MFCIDSENGLIESQIPSDLKIDTEAADRATARWSKLLLLVCAGGFDSTKAIFNPNCDKAMAALAPTIPPPAMIKSKVFILSLHSIIG